MMHRKIPAWRCRFWAMAVASGVAADAGSLSLDRFVIPSGGGTSRSARFHLDGSAGQPVAESVPSTDSSFAIAERAGFWSQTVRWINATPVAQLDVIERRPGQSSHVLISSLLANDTATDMELLAFVSFSGTTAAGGSIYRDGPWLIYQPPTSGADPVEDSFTYTARDALGALAIGTVRIQIADIPDGGAPNAVSVERLDGPPPLILVHFLGIAGRSYQVETSDAVDGPWTSSVALTAASDGSMVYSETETSGSRFFRIRETP